MQQEQLKKNFLGGGRGALLYLCQTSLLWTTRRPPDRADGRGESRRAAQQCMMGCPGCRVASGRWDSPSVLCGWPVPVGDKRTVSHLTCTGAAGVLILSDLVLNPGPVWVLRLTDVPSLQLLEHSSAPRQRAVDISQESLRVGGTVSHQAVVQLLQLTRKKQNKIPLTS